MALNRQQGMFSGGEEGFRLVSPEGTFAGTRPPDAQPTLAGLDVCVDADALRAMKVEQLAQRAGRAGGVQAYKETLEAHRPVSKLGATLEELRADPPLPPREYQPRWVAFAEAHGRGPADPRNKTTDYMAWIDQQIRTWRRLNRRTNEMVPLTDAEQEAFTTWLTGSAVSASGVREALVELNDGRWITADEARARYERKKQALAAGRPLDPTGDYGVRPTTFPPPRGAPPAPSPAARPADRIRAIETPKERPMSVVPPEATGDAPPNVRPEDLPHALAERAHTGTSHRPDLRAQQEQQSYVAHMTRVWRQLRERVRNDDEVVRALALFRQYALDWRSRYFGVLEARSGLVSTLVAGPANFPVERQRKRSEAFAKQQAEFFAWDAKRQRVMYLELRPDQVRAVSADRADAIDVLKQKIADAKNLRLRGRDRQNNAANIRRMEDRIAQLEAERARPAQTFDFAGGRVEENLEKNRIQLFFSEKPSAELRSKLKARGFRWAPSENAWQRQRNEATRFAVQQVLGIPWPATSSTSTAPPAEDPETAEVSTFEPPPVEDATPPATATPNRGRLAVVPILADEPPAPSRPSKLFVLSTLDADKKEFWQINGAGPRMTVKTASQKLSDMAPHPPPGANQLDKHRLAMPFDIVRQDGTRVPAMATWGRGSEGGWSTLEQWKKSGEALERYYNKVPPAAPPATAWRSPPLNLRERLGDLDAGEFLTFEHDGARWVVFRNRGEFVTMREDGEHVIRWPGPESVAQHLIDALGREGAQQLAATRGAIERFRNEHHQADPIGFAQRGAAFARRVQETNQRLDKLIDVILQAVADGPKTEGQLYSLHRNAEDVRYAIARGLERGVLRYANTFGAGGYDQFERADQPWPPGPYRGIPAGPKPPPWPPEENKTMSTTLRMPPKKKGKSTLYGAINKNLVGPIWTAKKTPEEALAQAQQEGGLDPDTLRVVPLGPRLAALINRGAYQPSTTWELTAAGVAELPKATTEAKEARQAGKKATKEAREAEKAGKRAVKEGKEAEKAAKKAAKEAREAEKAAKAAERDRKKAEKETRQVERGRAQAEKDDADARKAAERERRQRERQAKREAEAASGRPLTATVRAVDPLTEEPVSPTALGAELRPGFTTHVPTPFGRVAVTVSPEDIDPRTSKFTIPPEAAGKYRETAIEQGSEAARRRARMTRARVLPFRSPDAAIREYMANNGLYQNLDLAPDVDTIMEWASRQEVRKGKRHVTLGNTPQGMRLLRMWRAGPRTGTKAVLRYLFGKARRWDQVPWARVDEFERFLAAAIGRNALAHGRTVDTTITWRPEQVGTGSLPTPAEFDRLSPEIRDPVRRAYDAKRFADAVTRSNSALKSNQKCMSPEASRMVKLRIRTFRKYADEPWLAPEQLCAADPRYGGEVCSYDPLETYLQELEVCCKNNSCDRTVAARWLSDARAAQVPSDDIPF